MATYDYRCEHCGDFEIVCKMGEAKPEEICTACGKPAKKLISGLSGIAFKGTGFYKTDYPKES